MVQSHQNEISGECQFLEWAPNQTVASQSNIPARYSDIVETVLMKPTDVSRIDFGRIAFSIVQFAANYS